MLLSEKDSFIKVVLDLQPHIFDIGVANRLTTQFTKNCKKVPYEEFSKIVDLNQDYKLYFLQEPSRDFKKILNLLIKLNKNDSIEIKQKILKIFHNHIIKK